ncbi:MAG: hypothetical protein A2W91_19430 [Bacteroidetes bacterium GWF2_38_335]|nr:MAG: hypothetical protein A2W91_19430 [Bacteroidetes bacterium GWF2_38_335]OFY79931.1 MAG: hypothetical protein A2281_10830 [Bacteroidetes bacterium RIFOXYA12_FULL_38_20]HBS86388.1 hypothetical protein [Bacteroidales bacterium]
MRNLIKINLLLIVFILASCSIIEKTSRHGFESGYYHLHKKDTEHQKVWVEVEDDKYTVYKEDDIGKLKELVDIPFECHENPCDKNIVLIKKSLDIDLTTILLKYRPAFGDTPAQLNTEFNAAFYGGWRFDKFKIKAFTNPVGKTTHNLLHRGFDFGVFAGPGTTLVSPFTTAGNFADEYNGMVIQYGVGGFLESNVASFGISVGYDYLLSPQRDIWIYDNKIWIGFVIGLALN